MTQFKDLNLDARILSALDKKGYTSPTPIQQQAIPHILEGKDLMGIAQTGTGKTAAFSLPILHNLAQSDHKAKKNHMRCLVLTPTRELASQIADNVEAYGADLGLTSAVIFGGVGEKPQIDKLAKGIDIVIATPGRLIDLMNQGYVDFSQIEIFVLDEADRMLDMGFINDVKKVVARLPQKRQALFFSATMSDAIARLANTILKTPLRVEITPQATTVERISQRLMYVDRANKILLLKDLLKGGDVKNVLVFSQTKHGANKMLERLQRDGIKVAAIHGNKSQSVREKALDDFRSGAVNVLIATDIAARGIDVPGLSHVINYDIPQDPESYVHRIGRTARAGREGVAISFCDDSERVLLSAVEKLIRMKIPVDATHAYHGVAAAAGEPRRLSKGANNLPVRNSSSSTQNRERKSTSEAKGEARRIGSGSRLNRDYKVENNRAREGQTKENHNRNSSAENSERQNHQHQKNRKPKRASIGEKLKSFFGFSKKGKASREEPAQRRDHAEKKRPYGSSKKFSHKRRQPSR